jgi:hypothetical protein
VFCKRINFSKVTPQKKKLKIITKAVSWERFDISHCQLYPRPAISKYWELIKNHISGIGGVAQAATAPA